MVDGKMRIAGFKLADGSFRRFDTSNNLLTLYTFVKEVKDADVETIVFGEIDRQGKIIWEKSFIGGEVDLAFSKRIEDAQK